MPQSKPQESTPSRFALLEHSNHGHGPHITVMQYNASKVEEAERTSFDGFAHKPRSKAVTWVDVDGIEDLSLLRTLFSLFDIQDIILDEVSSTTMRPKVEDYRSYLHIVLRMMRYEGPDVPILAESVHLIVGRNFVISVQEGAEGDVFNSVRDRIRRNLGSIRQLGPDFLVYELLEAVIDNYFHILEELGELVEDLQDQMLDDPNARLLREVRDMKKTLRFLRKAVWPLREVIGELEREDSPLIDDANNIHFRRAYEHSIQAMDLSETTRDTLSDMLDIYLSSVSNRLNQVMKTLTVITVIFMPLTFIAGVYGMNFEFMPEIHWRYGYLMIMGLMTVITVVMILYFRRKQWL
jgi:magnesium transporter